MSRFQAGAQFYPLLTRREDSKNAFPINVLRDIPHPNFDLNEAIRSFASKGFHDREAVALCLALIYLEFQAGAQFYPLLTRLVDKKSEPSNIDLLMNEEDAQLFIGCIFKWINEQS